MRYVLLALALVAAWTLQPDRVVISGDDVQPLRVVSKPPRFQMEPTAITTYGNPVCVTSTTGGTINGAATFCSTNGNPAVMHVQQTPGGNWTVVPR